MNRKRLITILATTAIMAALTAPMLFSHLAPASATTYTTEGLTATGVLASDSYLLYPFEKTNLMIGFSRYGEMINGDAGVGLDYGGMDVFANPDVLESDWSQGWFIDIHYADLENHYKRAWAFALYTDLAGSGGIGKEWQENCTDGPLAAPHGGRKTNVWATSDPLAILYDGPRKFVAVANTTLYDHHYKEPDDALVSITITLIFNKVKKHVTLLKDVKRLQAGKFGRVFQVEFSNRGEWDIGEGRSPPCYANFYDDYYTYYDHHYHDFYNATNDITGYDVCQMIDKDGEYVGFAAFWPNLFGKLVDGTTHITRSTVLSSLCTRVKNHTWENIRDWDEPEGCRTINFTDKGWDSSDPYPVGLGAISDEPMVFLNGILLSGDGVDYTWESTEDVIEFVVEPEDDDIITIVYKHETPEEIEGNPDDMVDHTPEPDTPYVIGEWCFELRNQDRMRQFRAVTAYGLMDRHDADDNEASGEDWYQGGGDRIDSEVQYYLDELFVPYDLWDAVHKDTWRQVLRHNVTDTEEDAEYIIIYLPYDFVYAADWTEYCSWAEKVEWDGELKTPYRARNIFDGYNYTYSSYYNAIVIEEDNVPPEGTIIKVLYSTYYGDREEFGAYEWLIVGRNAASIDSAGAAYISEAFDSIKDIEVRMVGLDINETRYGPYAPFVMARANTGTKDDYRDELDRVHLRNDWCNTTPVSSSNMIFMAGPTPNMGTEYFNEFTNVFFPKSKYVSNDTGHANTILALTCWNKTTYTSGYGVISVYKDLNGTVGLVFWGYRGQDFYYTCKWFWDWPDGIETPDGYTVYSGIEYLQHENWGVTDIILEIDYDLDDEYDEYDPKHPMVTVSEERLGTISEKTPHDP